MDYLNVILLSIFHFHKYTVDVRRYMLIIAFGHQQQHNDVTLQMNYGKPNLRNFEKKLTNLGFSQTERYFKTE